MAQSGNYMSRLEGTSPRSWRCFQLSPSLVIFRNRTKILSQSRSCVALQIDLIQNIGNQTLDVVSLGAITK